MPDEKKFKMIIDPMPGNFSSRNQPIKTGLWQVVMCEIDNSGTVIRDSPHNQIQVGNLEYDEAMSVCNKLQKDLEKAERNRSSN